MKHRFFLLYIIWCGAAALWGQSAAQVSAFLDSAWLERPAQLQGDKRIRPSQVAAARRAVWQAWRAAAQRNRAARLSLHFPPLSQPLCDSIALPPAYEGSVAMPYYVGRKGERPAAGYPALLYLHGSGPRDGEWAAGLSLARSFDDAPSVYVIPQIPQAGPWYRWYQQGKQWVWRQLLRELLLRSDTIDARRLYVFGISEGGYGSQRLASYYADYWAAAGPMAGGEPLRNAPPENCQHVGFSLLTGARDFGFYRERLTREALAAFDSLQQGEAGGYNHRIALIPDRGHGIDYRPTTPYLVRFSRTPQPAHFAWEDFEMDGAHRPAFYNLEVVQRPCDTLRQRYDFTVRDNVVHLRVSNVQYEVAERDPQYGIELRVAKRYTPATQGRWRLYLSEDLVDLSRPVQIYLNDRLVHNAPLRPSRAAMVRSVALWADPLRIFPAEVEITLNE